MKRKNKLILLSTCALVFVVSFSILYLIQYTKNDLNDTRDNIVKAEEEKVPIQEDKIKLEPHLSLENSLETTASNEDRIKSFTKMVFQYYYELDDKLVESTTQPPYYLLNMDRQQLQNSYPDWTLESFSSEKVVLRKNLKQKNTDGYFKVGTYEGYICVFYENGEIREITQTPVNSLPKEEQRNIKRGIKVYGEENLIKLLEDYTS